MKSNSISWIDQKTCKMSVTYFEENIKIKFKNILSNYEKNNAIFFKSILKKIFFRDNCIKTKNDESILGKSITFLIGDQWHS